MCFYVATLILLGWVRFPFVQWMGLIAVTAATVGAVAIFERWQWPLGLFVPPRLATSEFARGVVWGLTLVGTAALLIVVTTPMGHAPGRGVPWIELMTVFVPAAVHEELLFRGYPFQKLLRWNRNVAVLLVALVFAALHSGNEAVSWLGLANIFFGGVLLGLAYERFRRLWFPIGLHLAWNVMSGPILGHEVSGYEAMETILIETGHGPGWLTGGEFGIEGSVWMTLVEILGIAALVLLSRWQRTRTAPGRPE